MGKRSRKNSSYVQMFRKYPDVVSVIQICEMLDLSKTKVYAIIKSGELRRIPCGRIIKVLNKPQFCVVYSKIRSLIMVAGLATLIHGVTDVPILGVQSALGLIFVVSGCSVERNERISKELSNLCEIYEK